MAMTVVVTRNAPERARGFLASCMCEIAPGVYTGPSMTPSVRKRVWEVMNEWWPNFTDWSVVMTWPDNRCVGGQAFRVLGAPRNQLVERDGVFLVRSEMTVESWRALKMSDAAEDTVVLEEWRGEGDEPGGGPGGGTGDGGDDGGHAA